jgi:adenylate cyclase
MVAYFATYYDLFWLLDDAQRALLFRLSPTYFDDDRGTWGLALAGAHALEGRHVRALAYADSARVAFEAQIAENPENAQLHVLLGTALAYLGRKADAVQEGRRGLEMNPPSVNAFSGPYFQHQMARIYVLVGEADSALDELEALLRMPYFVTRAWLPVDPTWDPLRRHPGFQRLVRAAE